VTIGGRSHPSSWILMNLVQELGGKEQATVFGTSHKTSILNAALVNGAMSHVLDFDDTHLPALMHPSAPVLPALFALGEYEGVSGEDFLLAFLMGFEAETRISRCMGASHYDVGWHSTATMGRFGAAAGAAKLAKLSKEQIAFALGLAGTQASGIRKVFGTMTKSFHPGKAAFDGLLSALLAQKGYTCSDNILEGPKGLGNILSPQFDVTKGVRDLGKKYMIMDLTCKPCASCLYTPPTIDAVVNQRCQHRLKADAVKKVSVNVAKFCFDAANIQNPRTGLEGKFSVAFCAAIALLEGQAGEDVFTDARVKDGVTAEMLNKISVEKKDDLGEQEAEVSVALANGEVFKTKTEKPLGSPENPISDRALEEKAAILLRPTFSEGQIEKIVKKIRTLETIENLTELPDLFAK